MNNSTEIPPQTQPQYVVLLIAPFAFITVLVNSFFFIMGLRKLKKNAHNMFVISMCGGDSLYGVSLFMLTIVNRNQNPFSELCFAQIIIYFVSVNVTLTVALLICIERCITIKLRNFGQLMQTDGWKNKLAGALLLSSSGYVIMCFLVVPRLEVDSRTCVMNIYYDSYHYRIIMALLSGLFICLFSAIIIIYISIVCILYKFTHQVKKVLPRPLTVENIEINEDMSKNEKRQNTNNDINFTNLADNTLASQDIQGSSNALGYIKCTEKVGNDDASLFSVNVDTPDNLEESKSSERSEKRNRCSAIAHNRCISPDCFKDETSTKTSTDNGQLKSLDKDKFANDTTDSKKETNQLQSWKKWEMRALTTSGLIIGSTLLLFGPITVCLILDAFGISFPIAVGNTSALLVAFHCVINPFIYALRFQELREGIKNFFCCKSTNS